MNDIEKRAHAVQAAMNHKVGGITPAKYLHLNEAQWAEVVGAIIAALSALPQEGRKSAVTVDEWIASGRALLSMDELKTLVPHGIGGHARTIITALCDALESRAVPEGWVLMPVELTDAMTEAATIHLSRLAHDDEEDQERGSDAFWRNIGCADAIYRSLLAAKPEPPK